MDDFSANDIKKVFKGSFDYYRGEQIYCEETFQVVRHIKELTTEFISEAISRISTGELLRLNTNFVVGKNWLPRYVSIKKRLGRNDVQEVFEYEMRSNQILYSFINNTRVSIDELRLATPPIFHITTPTAASSFLFLLAKKFHTTDRNDYTVFASNNMLEYKEEVKAKSISVEKLSATEDSITIGEKQLQGAKYHLYQTPDSDGASMKEKYSGPVIQAFISKHLSIPYLIQEPNGNRIQIKYLNNLESY